MLTKKFNPRARHKARRLALQALYQWQMTADNLVTIEAQFLENIKTPKKIDLEYFSELFHQVPAKIDVLDKHMQTYLDRDFSELNPIEIAIMRIGIYELVEHQEIPYRVVINEALELAKTFGAEEGYKYVNGILDKVAHEVRVKETSK